MGSEVVVRDPSNPWYISREQWPDDEYPAWFQGLAYMISGQLALRLPAIALDTPYLFVDDVYVGILISKVPDVTIHRHQELSSHVAYGSKLSLYDGLYHKFYHAETVFYHVPNVSLYSEWWRCSLNDTCPSPPVYTILYTKPLLSLLVLLLCLTLLYKYFQMRFLTNHRFTINVRNFWRKV